MKSKIILLKTYGNRFKVSVIRCQGVPAKFLTPEIKMQ